MGLAHLIFYHAPKYLVSPWAVSTSVQMPQFEVILCLFVHTASKTPCSYSSYRWPWPCFWVIASWRDAQHSRHVKMEGEKNFTDWDTPKQICRSR